MWDRCLYYKVFCRFLLTGFVLLPVVQCATSEARRQKKIPSEQKQSRDSKIIDPREDLTLKHNSNPPADIPTKYRLEGHASWYGEKFHGQTSACGEPYNMYRFTAAHKTLPFHTIVRVVEKSTQKSVVVRITDRGPYVDDRIIDLSYAAASDLGLVQKGVTDVRLDILRWGDDYRDF